MPKSINDFASQLDATIAQVAQATASSVPTVRRKIKAGLYQSFLSGRVRKVVVASVLADRESEMRNAELGPDPVQTRKPRGWKARKADANLEAAAPAPPAPSVQTKRCLRPGRAQPAEASE